MARELHEIRLDGLESGQHVQFTRESDGKTKVGNFIVEEPHAIWPYGTFIDTGVDETLAAKLGGSVEVGEERMPMHPDYMRRIAVGKNYACFYLLCVRNQYLIYSAPYQKSN